MDSAARVPRAPLRPEPRPEWRVSRGELRCRIEEEGIDRVALRLAVTTEALRSAVRGELRLRPERVLALRLGEDLRPLVEVILEQRLAEASDA